jgi:uncharacterized protein YbaA (DUF1428 family)
MSKYADAFLLPIPEDNISAYKRLATAARKLLLKHGPPKYREYVASDLDVENVVPFPKRIKFKQSETLVYASVEFKSETHRNNVMKAIFADPAMAL